MSLIIIYMVMYMFACGAQLPTDCAETAVSTCSRDTLSPRMRHGRARASARVSRPLSPHGHARPRQPGPATQNETRSHYFRMQVLASATARPRAVGALAGHSRAATARRRAPAVSSPPPGRKARLPPPRPPPRACRSPPQRRMHPRRRSATAATPRTPRAASPRPPAHESAVHPPRTTRP